VNRSIKWTLAAVVVAVGAAYFIRPPDTGAVAANDEPLLHRDSEMVPGPDAGKAGTHRASGADTSRDGGRPGFVNSAVGADQRYVHKPTERHPYEYYDNETLVALAYADADAASILGLRLRRQDEKRSLKYILRSVALSGRPDAIAAFRNASPHPVAIDGRPVARSLREQYVLSVVADTLHPDPAEVALWEARIRAEFPDPEREIASLRRQADAIVQRMRQVQREVYGSATIGGLDDA